MRDPRETRVRDWLDDHPITCIYLIVVVTANLAFSVTEALTR